MAYFDNEKNARDYIRMAAGYDGGELIGILRKHLSEGSSVLELGMGPGTDLDILSRYYTATGSDFSNVFLKLYREKHPEADLIHLDATVLKTKRRFQGIYSNKVLHHLETGELAVSLERQRNLLHEEGVVLHSFWLGDREEMHHGLRFVYYSEETIRKLFETHYKVQETGVYSELAKKDSLYIVAKKA